MTEVIRCAHCGSRDISWQAQTVQCNTCGLLTNTDGEPVDPASTESLPLNDTPNPTHEVVPGGVAATRARTPDGIADHGTNTFGDIARTSNAAAEQSYRDNDTNETQHWGVPENPSPGDNVETHRSDMTTEDHPGFVENNGITAPAPAEEAPAEVAPEETAPAEEPAEEAAPEE